VVNIASILGLEPYEFTPIYSGIKHAVVGLTRAFGVRKRMCDSHNVANRSGIKWEWLLHALQRGSSVAKLFGALGK
jgi:hypothetical protein